MKSREDLLDEARQNLKEMTVQEVHDYLEGGADPILLDIRGLDEWERGHLKGAVHIPRGILENELEDKLSDKSKEVIVYCAGGVRSLLGGETMQALGYENVISMDGGYGDWEDAGLPVEIPPLPEEEVAPEDPDLLETELAHLERVIAEKKKRLEAVRNKA
ncbi:MAG: rhodanese-like domain-containing protein [bacterium]|nr:rhodanese-like domain-containing protein [bacterium]